MSRKIYDVSGRKAALPVIPTRTNFIARKGINVFKKEPPEKESRREILLQFLL